MASALAVLLILIFVLKASTLFLHDKNTPLRRRRNASDLREVVQAVEEGLRGTVVMSDTGKKLNDWSMTIALLLEKKPFSCEILDPESVELRARQASAWLSFVLNGAALDCCYFKYISSDWSSLREDK